MSHPKPPLPTLADVKDLPQNLAYPSGFDSAPSGPAALVESLGINSVIDFALTYSWATSDQKKSARGWARNMTNACAWAATMREYQDTLSQDQLMNINLSCNSANFLGGKSFVNEVYARVGGKLITVSGVSFPAQFTTGTGLSGETTSELGPEQAKQLAFDQLISDVREGAYLMEPTVA